MIRIPQRRSAANERKSASWMRAGFTLVESLICIGIIGIVASLLLTGVAAIRESSRKLQCQNNLRQSILGLIQVADRQRQIPGLYSTLLHAEPPHDDVVGCNALIAIAKEIAIPMRVQKNVIRFDDATFGESLPPPLFTCPSTGDRNLATRLNLGVEPVFSGREPNNFLFAHRKSELLSVAKITDGLSNTAALAERPWQTDQAKIQRAIALDNTSESASEAERKTNCQVAYSSGFLYTTAQPGCPHWWNNSYDACYDHSRPPNDAQVDCMSNLHSWGEPLTATTIHVVISARSYHAGGANAAFWDGSVRFINNYIDARIWRALGTHDAAEAVDGW